MTTTKKLNAIRRIQLTLVLLLLLWLFFDAMLYLALSYIGSTRNLFFAPEIPSEKMLQEYATKYYHPRWGWDIGREFQGPLGSRKGRSYSAQPVYDMKIFGDSFSYGDDVEDHQTFEYLVEQKTGRSFLNFGVGGYATDQALIKYRDNKIATKYTFLGILDENIGRCMTVWWNFYEQGFAGTKPRFGSGPDGINLVENPITSRDQLARLREPEFIEYMKQFDYWQGYYESINAPEKLQWPATLTLVKHFDFFSRYLSILLQSRLFPSLENSMEMAKYYHLYRPGSEGLAVLTHIVDEFVGTARSRNEVPVILLYPIRRSVDIYAEYGQKPYQTLVRHLQEGGYAYIDFGDIFVSEKYPDYYLNGNGHFSQRGNDRVADAIIDYVRQREMTQTN